jgi:hypothetical protein
MQLSWWYRLPLALVILFAAGAAGPAPPAVADPSAPPSPIEPCQIDELKVSSDTSPGPLMSAPGQTGTNLATLRNPTSATFSDAYFDFELVVSPNTTDPGSAPVMSWSIDGAPHALTLTWYRPPAPQAPYWYSRGIALPTIAAGSTHALRFQASFRADNPTGFYSVSFMVSSRACGVIALGANYEMAFDYYTGCCLGGNGGSSSSGSSSRSIGTGKPATQNSPPVSAAPSASQAMPPPTPTASASPALGTPSSPPASAPPQALRASTRPLPHGAWLGLAAILAAAAVATGLGWYRRRPHPPADK